MKIILLTHQRELDRKSNTGQLVIDVLGFAASRIIWDRVNPDGALLSLIQQAKVGLLFPELEASEKGEGGQPRQVCIDENNKAALAEFEHLVIIDATWQEARKIFNRSAYLHLLTKVNLSHSMKSSFRLRRNQIDGGLCTAECVGLLLTYAGQAPLADELMTLWGIFNLEGSNNKA